MLPTSFRHHLIPITFVYLLAWPLALNAEESNAKTRPTLVEEDASKVTTKSSFTMERYLLYLKYLLERDPKQTRPRILLGRLYLEQGNLAAAEQEFEIARKMGSDPEEVLPLLGQVLLAQGNARGVLERITPPNTTSAALRARLSLLYGQAQLMLDQFDAAMASFTEALKLGGALGAARVGLAWVALARNDLDRAEAEVARAFSARDGQAEAWLVKAEVLRLRGKPEDAREAFAKAIALNPRNLSARLGKAAMELALHQPETAAEDLRIASQIAPEHPLVSRLQALLAYERGDLGSVDEMLHQTLNLDQKMTSPASIPLLDTLITLEMKAGHHQSVLLIARRIQKQAPHLALGYATEGAIRMAQQDWNGAIRALEAAYQREPNGVLALDIYTALSRLGKKYPEAILEDWFSRSPNDLDTRLMAAIAAHQNGQIQMARNYYEKVLDNQPEHPVALNNLAWLYLERGDPRALVLAKQAYQVAPDNPQVIDTYHQALAKIGSAMNQ